MNKYQKVLIGVGTAVTILAPMIPDTVNINLNVPITIQAQMAKKEKPYQVITATCNLTNEKIQNEIKVCEYTCDSPSKQRIFHTHFYKSATCSKTITEQIKENK